MAKGLLTVDAKHCPSQIKHSLLIKDTVHKDEPQENQSLDGVKVVDLHDPLAMEIPSDDEGGEPQEVDQEVQGVQESAFVETLVVSSIVPDPDQDIEQEIHEVQEV